MDNIELSIFGESHGAAIGIVIGGLPAGIKLDMDEIRWFMKRRAPGQNQMSTPRKEKDEFQIDATSYCGNPLLSCPACWHTGVWRLSRMCFHPEP